jgi:hypothetical protein
MRINTFLLSLICLFTGFITAYIFFSSSNDNHVNAFKSTHSKIGVTDEIYISSPFNSVTDKQTISSRLDFVEKEIIFIKQQLSHIQSELQSKDAVSDNAATRSRTDPIDTRTPSLFQRRLYQTGTLVKGCIDPALAEDIVRKKNRIEIKRLELQDRANRNNYLNTQQYYDELEVINKLDFTLREVLGDDRYDEYLYASKQNNRIKIASVMLGSAAERAGIQDGDIVLSYDNKRMFGWQELKNATVEGQLGDYVSINVYRNGEVYSFSVPRGPLGVQLGAARLQP